MRKATWLATTLVFLVLAIGSSAHTGARPVSGEPFRFGRDPHCHMLLMATFDVALSSSQGGDLYRSIVDSYPPDEYDVFSMIGFNGAWMLSITPKRAPAIALSVS